TLKLGRLDLSRFTPRTLLAVSVNLRVADHAELINPVDAVIREHMPVLEDIHLTHRPQVLANFQVSGEPAPVCRRLKHRRPLLDRFLIVSSNRLQAFSRNMPKEAVAGVVRIFNCDRDALGTDRHNFGAVRILARAGDPLPPENPITGAELRHSGLSLINNSAT